MRSRVFYPFLFVLYIILNPLLHNWGQLDPRQAFEPLVVLLLVSAGGLLALYLWLRDWGYAAYLVFLGLAFFFLSPHLNRLIEAWLPGSQEQLQGVFLLLWAVLIVALGLPRVWRRLGGEHLTPRLNLVMGLALASLLIVSAPALLQNPLPQFIAAQDAQAAQVEDGPDFLPDTGVPGQLDCSSQPDIYYFVLDGYGRADVLQEMYGVDTTSFLNFLEEQGFYVASDSHSNYIQTVFSIPSALNFTYLHAEPDGVSGWKYFRELIGDNRMLELLKACDYQTVAFESGFFFTDEPKVDLYLTQSAEVSEFESLLLAGTPTDVFEKALGLEPPTEFSYAAHRERIRFTFDQLQKLASRPGPQFVFAHILNPHPPFVFDAAGNAIDPERDYALEDGSDYKGSWAEYRAGYAGQVQYVNQQLEHVITAILKRSEHPPVIILQGDHGPGAFLDWGSPDRTCLWERTSIFNAYYLPDGGVAALYPSISPVNSFRVVLDRYFGANLPLLPDRTYFTSVQLPKQILDVTDQRTSEKNCPLP